MAEIAVYCASASGLARPYMEDARALGIGMAERGMKLIYGGGDVGLMREVARAVHDGGGHVTGYIPDRLMAIEGRAYETCDELIITQTMQERKRSIFSRADAFVALAGGLGTMEEFMEVTTLRKLGYLDKPIILMNTVGFWNGLLDFLDYTVSEGFSPPLDGLFTVAGDAASTLAALEQALCLPSS